MNRQIDEYLQKYPREIVELFDKLRDIILESAPSDPREVLWANLPSYYVDESFVRLITFKDHINIEAKAVLEYKEMLSGYKITPKGMLQIYLKQAIPFDILKQIFSETIG